MPSSHPCHLPSHLAGALPQHRPGLVPHRQLAPQSRYSPLLGDGARLLRGGSGSGRRRGGRRRRRRSPRFALIGILKASWGRPSRWPERTRSLRPARSRSLSAAEPEPASAPVPPAAAAAAATASAMASALCRRPGPLGAGERSLKAAPGATIRCGASRQPPRRLGGGCHAPGAS